MLRARKQHKIWVYHKSLIMTKYKKTICFLLYFSLSNMLVLDLIPNIFRLTFAPNWFRWTGRAINTWECNCRVSAHLNMNCTNQILVMKFSTNQNNTHIGPGFCHVPQILSFLCEWCDTFIDCVSDDVWYHESFIDVHPSHRMDWKTDNLLNKKIQIP